jgi:hypothetical protein
MWVSRATFWRREDTGTVHVLGPISTLNGKGEEVLFESNRKGNETYDGSNATDFTGHGQESQQQESAKTNVGDPF